MDAVLIYVQIFIALSAVVIYEMSFVVDDARDYVLFYLNTLNIIRCGILSDRR